MRLKLYISGQQVETFPDQSLLLTREVYTKDNVASTDIAYSQQITIPASEHNQKIFDYFHLVDYWEKPSPHTPYQGVASLEDGTDLNVIVEMRGFTFERAVIKTYQIAFYVHAPELFSRFANDNLADVDLSYFDFNLNQANVIASWEVDGPDYFCPVMAHSRPFYYITDAAVVAGDISKDGTGVELADCKPAYLLTKLIEKIFTHYQQNITWGTKPAAHLDELFVLPSLTAGGFDFQVDSTLYYFSGERRTNFDFPLIVAYQLLEMETELSDVNNNWYDQKYHAPTAGGYSFAVSVNQRYNSSIRLAYRINGGTWEYQDYYGKIVTAHFYIDLDAADEVEFAVAGLIINPLAPNRCEGATIEGKISESFIYDKLIEANLQMPEMKVVDFIKGFLQAFKLTLLQTGVNTYKIYDNQSIYGDGTIRDWSRYVDMKVMSYQKRDGFKSLLLKHQTGEDNYNVLFNSYAGRQFGMVNYDTGMQFGESQIKVESIFTIFPPVFLGKQISGTPPIEDGTTDLLLHQQIDAAGEPVKANFLLFYRNGSDGVASNYWLQNGVDGNGPTFSEQTTFGFYSSNQARPCLVDTPTVGYSMENPAFGEVSQACLSYEFWRDTLEVFQNNSAFQLLGIPFRPPASEMAAFRINDTILINGIYHIPLKAMYDYVNDIIKLDLLIYHPSVPAILPTIAGSGEFMNAVDIPTDTMHTLGGRRSGERIFKPKFKNLWKAKSPI